jgi:hypothetical protein
VPAATGIGTCEPVHAAWRRGRLVPILISGNWIAPTGAVAPDFSMLLCHDNIEFSYQDGYQIPN